MHLILLSGGSGKRLWPLSNDVRSKQFLKLLKDENGKPLSMIQRVFKQLSEAGEWDSINVVAGAAQKDSIELQIGTDYNLIIEKERRDTFPAIALACAYLQSEVGAKNDDIVCVLPVDSYVETEYFSRLNYLEEGIKQGYEYMLLGVKPTFPTEKYGYIVPTEGKNDLFLGESPLGVEVLPVKEFVEKPKASLAGDIIGQGALWNCGVFCFRMNKISEHLSTDYGITDFSYENINKNFSIFNKTSFDYEILEKASDIGVVPYSGMWMDLGTWQTVTCEMSNISEGNVVIGEHVRTHI
jgi:mannose-1-phosphate guanylyltransferase